MKSHQIFPSVKSPSSSAPFFLATLFFFFFFLAEQHILILWIVILLEVFFEKSYLDPGSNSKMYWYPGLQNLFGLLHIKSFLQLTVQLFPPLPSHLEFFPLYFVSGWTWISMLHGYLWLGFFLHCLMSSVEISRLTGSWHFSEIYRLFSGHLKKKSILFFFVAFTLIFSLSQQEFRWI